MYLDFPKHAFVECKQKAEEKIRLCNSKTIHVTSAVAQKVLPQEEAPTCGMLKIVELPNSFVFQDNIVDICEIAMECIEHYTDDFLFI